MLESFVTEKFDYKKLTLEEQQKRGILGRLTGIIADTVNPTRNGRKYSSKLWEKVFNDPLMQEKISNRCLFGELGHPADREETDMEKIALCLAEQPKKGKDGKLYGVFDILDTPNGRILKTLCDYGCNIGISSRGSGDIVTDENGDESVDEDTYDCQGWDAVLVPAVQEARLQYVTEALSTKKYNKTLKTRLEESLSNASEDDKKVMEEGLSNLGITLNEDDLHPKFRKDAKSQYKDWDRKKDKINAKRAEIQKDLGELKDKTGKQLDPDIVDDFITGIAGKVEPFKLRKDYYNVERQNYPYYITVYEGTSYYHPEEGGYYQAGWEPVHSEGYNSFDEAEEALKGYWKDNSSTEVEFSPNLPTDDDNYSYSKNDAEYEPIYDGKNRLVGLFAEGKYIGQGQKIYIEPNKQYLSAEVGYQMYESLNEDVESSEILKPGKEFTSKSGHKIWIDSVDASFSPYDGSPRITMNYHYKLSDGKEGESRCNTEDLFNMLNEARIKTNSKSSIHESLKTEEDFVKDLLKVTQSYMKSNDTSEYHQEYDIDGDIYDGEYSEIIKEVRYFIYDILSKYIEGSDVEAVDNNEAMVEELQKSLKANKELKEKLVELQNKLSVSYAKESKLEEQVDKQRSAISNLTKSANKVSALNEKLNSLKSNRSSLNEELNSKNSEIDKLTETLNKYRDNRKALRETIQKKDEINKSLNEQLRNLDNKNKKLEEQYISVTKDFEIKKNEFSRKLENSNNLVEKYKKIAKASVDKYIDSQAIKYGITSNEIKTRLPESYNFDDIDRACEDASSYRVSFNKLPFNTMLNESKVKVRASEINKEALKNNNSNDCDDIDEQLLSLAESIK